MVSLRDKRDKMLFYDYIGMPHPEIATLLRSVSYVGYRDTSPDVINQIVNTVQDNKNHGSNSNTPEH